MQDDNKKLGRSFNKPVAYDEPCPVFQTILKPHKSAFK